MSSVKQVELDFTLTMHANFHIGSGAGMAGMADRVVLRMANKELVISASTVKVRTRYHCEQLARALDIGICGGRATHAELCKDKGPPCLICRLFGSEWRPSTLRFADACLVEALRHLVREQHPSSTGFDYQVVSHTRTRLNRLLRRVEEGALFTFEEGVKGLTFAGRIAGTLLCVETTVADIPLEVLALVAALRLVDRVGGKKTIGLGACTITVDNLIVDHKTVTTSLYEVSDKDIEELILYDDYRRSA